MWDALRTGTRAVWQAVNGALTPPRGKPTEAIQSALARVKTIVNSPRPLDLARGELRRVFRDIFDVEHMGRAVLWSHWGRRTPVEQYEFVWTFTDLLERLVVAHVRQLRWVTVMPVGEVVSESSAKVTWKVGTLQAAATVEYRLRYRDGHWRICDVLVNGRSFVASCREQCDHFIRSSSYRALVAEMPRWDRVGFIGPGSTLAPAATP
jgi:ABC-type transporter MlaC component